ncbi:type I-D CRISPR-associated helicase Cas3' [Cyanobacterium aponinum UTEX 3221]|uniref:type I-D CRISPR-associated helicase Cas3' n=1 Tax=Cyanobacterium aponinum TaxID=379064 RepID=UPI002B4BA452|nr:type I-D CRISPR-associated helicase Cas3' [Cyanobacterium aponinum]WRL36949.1 type I-D CRISPR-associated helicase Cas3' [Cyanobacterium aponinum UTEX 3221]
MIKLLSTWSEKSSQSIGDIQLVTHQAEVWEAIKDKNISIIFDTALTGDGKTLAALLPALYERKTLDKGLFAYPTNELIRDQVKQVNKWSETFNFNPYIGELNSQSLANSIEEENLNKIETLRTIAYDYDLILTNPDIVTLIHRLFYDKWGNTARIAQTFLNQYRYFVFDEFHIFNAPQVTNILDGIAFSRATLGQTNLNKFLFLSATPDEMLVKSLNQAGINYKIIQGKYLHGLKSSETHRRILQEVNLEIITCEKNKGGIENWLIENIERVKTFFADYPNSKGLVIVNSVFTAKRLIKKLKNIDNLNLTVGENTGLTNPKIRKISLEQQLIIATSTVDVGVDFAINFLVYESLDAGTFIQRLGRLGRHDGFDCYQAIALVPDWVKEKFNQLYPDGIECDRESFFNTVKNNIYQKPQEFKQYLSRWGTVLTTVRYCKLSSQKSQYQTLLENYEQEAKNLIGKTPNWDRLNELKKHKIILKELEFFRGRGQLDIWVNEPDTNAVISMNLIRLLSGTNFRLISEAEAKKISESVKQPFYKNNLDLYAKIENYLDYYEQVNIEFCNYLDNFNLYQAQELKGLRLKVKYPEIQKINRQLERLPLTTCVIDPNQYDIPALKRRYKLPAFFELHYVKDQSNKLYPVAFGLDALLLDSLFFWQKNNTAMIC